MTKKGAKPKVAKVAKVEEIKEVEEITILNNTANFNGKVWKWLLKLNEFLQTEDSSLIGLTDVQFRLNVNSRLPIEERIAVSTYEALVGSPQAKKSIENHSKFTDEQKAFAREIIDMARAVQTFEILKKTTDSDNRNSMGSYRVLQSDNKKHQQTNDLAALGTGNITINVLPPPQPKLDEVTIDIPHFEVIPTQINGTEPKNNHSIQQNTST